MIDNMEGQLTFADLGLLSTKTSPEPSPATAERTSKRSSRKSSGSQNRQLPVFLCLRGGDGAKQDVSMEWTDGGALRGEYTMHSFGESPKEENVSHLSQILEDCPHPKYSLSAKACLGILRRAERRGKTLPPLLQNALEEQIRRQQNG